MEISLEFMIVEFDRDSVVSVLVDSPHKPDEVEAQVFAVPPPRRGSRLERFVILGLE